MAKKNNLKNTKMKIAPITNPELEKVIASLKEGASTEKQDALIAALKKAKLLAPCDFDVDLKQNADGTLQNNRPNQIKFYLINTNDGHTFFPVFTDLAKAEKMNFGENIKPKMVVRSAADYDRLLEGNKNASGFIINPGPDGDNVVIPRNLAAIIAGRAQVPETVVRKTPAPLNITYSEPTVYPTRMVNAVYDKASETQEISRIWLKMKHTGPAVSFFLAVESDDRSEHVLNEIREAAVPLAKDMEVEVVFVNETIMKNIIKEAVALYDRNLEL